MRIIPFILAALLLVGLAPTPIPNGVVAIKHPYEDRWAGCTAFYVKLNQVITAAHCMPEDDAPVFIVETGEQLRLIKSSNEFALYETQTLRTPLRIGNVSVGDQTRAIGNAVSDGLLTLARIVVKIDKDGDLWLDGPVIPGMSGGPVLNEKGEAVGVLQATNMAVSFACGPEEIRAFLK